MNHPLHYSLLLPAALIAILAAGCQRYSGTAVSIDQGAVVQLRKDLGVGASGKTEAAATIVEPTGFATIRGTFKLEGTPLSRKPLAVNKDQDICMPGGKRCLAKNWWSMPTAASRTW